MNAHESQHPVIYPSAQRHFVRNDNSNLSDGDYDELDAVICELGLKSEAAMAAGDKAGARELSDRMYAAIKSRTPEHQARLAEAVERRVRDELTFHGTWTDEVLRRAPA
jgi:hypothetical protein